MIEGVKRTIELMEAEQYIVDRTTATSVFLAVEMKKPLLVEGYAGVGKTEIAKVLAAALNTRLIRLQCYEGLDVATTIYEWNYPKQILRLTIENDSKRSEREKEELIFSESFLLKRPLLESITELKKSPVLLIDEIDRADEEFEAFLLELLSDFQVTIPELGTIHAKHRPYVILTSNRTRALSDALKRRCVYLWMDYPDFKKELKILKTRIPRLNAYLAQQIVEFMQVIRRLPLNKTPGAAETVEWATSLMLLHADHLDPDLIVDTLGYIVKEHDDLLQLSRQRVLSILTELSKLEAGEACDGTILEEVAGFVMQEKVK